MLTCDLYGRGVRARVEEGKDCWAYQIESLAALVKLNSRVTTLEANALMKVRCLSGVLVLSRISELNYDF